MVGNFEIPGCSKLPTKLQENPKSASTGQLFLNDQSEHQFSFTLYSQWLALSKLHASPPGPRLLASSLLPSQLALLLLPPEALRLLADTAQEQ
jgi:hypothetical protein